MLRSPFTYTFIALAWILQSCAASETPDINRAGAKEYAASAHEITPLLVGSRIPDTYVRAVAGDSVRLRAVVSKKPTILIFYRGGWCPYCNAHMAELQKAEDRLAEMGYQLLAVSADKPALLQQTLSTHDLSYTLLSDASMETSKAFGLAFKLDKSTVDRYRKSGIDFEKRSGYNHHLLPVPAVYLTGRDGITHFQYVNPDYTTRLKSQVLLAAAEAYYDEAMAITSTN